MSTINRAAILQAIATREKERKQLDERIADQKLLVDMCESGTPFTVATRLPGGVFTAIADPANIPSALNPRTLKPEDIARGFDGLKQDRLKKVLEEKFFRYAYNGDVAKCEKYLLKCQEHDSDIIEFFIEDLRLGAPVFFNPMDKHYEGEEALRQMGDWMKGEHAGRKAVVEALKFEAMSKAERKAAKKTQQKQHRKARKGK